MIRCNECGKKLGFFEGYRHPTMGKKFLLCSPCFDKIQQSIDDWRDFILLNSFNSKSNVRKFNTDWKFHVNQVIRFGRVFTIMKNNYHYTQNEIQSKKNLNHLHYKNSDNMNLIWEKV